MRRIERAVLAVALLLVVLLLAVSGAVAQEANRYGIFLDTVRVNIVNLEVMVFDRDGEPVTGLTLDDFEVLENGEPIEVTNFYAVEGGVRAAEPASVPPQAPDAAPTAPRPRSPSEQRFIVLLIDSGNIASNHRKRVFDELRRHLDRLMQPADRVMVVHQDGELTVEQALTSDPALIEEALARLEKVTGRGAMRALEPQLIQREIEAGASPPGSDALASGSAPGAGGPLQQQQDAIDARSTLSRVTAYAQATEAHVRQTMAALGRFIDSLAGLPGRKAVVYVSDGLELRPGEFLFRLWDAKYNTIAAQNTGVSNVDAEIERHALGGEFAELVATANANRVAFYTVEGGSQRGAGDISAASRTALVDPQARLSDGEKEESLRALASDTGGVPLLNDTGVVALTGQIEKDFNNYYSLGYPSPHEGDGDYHRVEVRVRRPGLRVRYLEGYRDKSADDQMRDLTFATLLHDVVDNPLGVFVEIGSERKSKKGYVVPVMVRIPLSKLVLIPQDDARVGRLSIFLAVQSEDGRLLPPQKIDVPVRIPEEQFAAARGQMAGYAAELQLRRGEQKLAVGVRDELAAVDSHLNLRLSVGDS